MTPAARLWGAVLFGVLGCGVLVALGLWQLDRLGQKLAIIAGIEARIDAAPIPVPLAPSPEADRYAPVTVTGVFTGEGVGALSSMPGFGPGVRLIAVLETADGRRLLIDRGFLPDGAGPRTPAPGPAEVLGNLDWPQDIGPSTPAPDLGRNLWFARAPAPIAAHLNAEPLLIVARETQGAAMPRLMATPLGVDIRNDHLEYAVTWFLLALVWAGMSLYLVVRLRRDRDA